MQLPLLLLLALVTASAAQTNHFRGAAPRAASVPTALTLNEAAGPFHLHCDEYVYFNVSAGNPCRDLLITATVTEGDDDTLLELYASRHVSMPTRNDLTWSSIKRQLLISHWDPEYSPGFYFIAVIRSCNGAAESAVKSLHSANGGVDFTIRAVEQRSDKDDIYLNQSLSINQLVLAQEYKFFRFCVESCADVMVNLENCISDAECPGRYSYPELLVSRTETRPTIHSYTYKLASVSRRTVMVNHTDPAASDHNGFFVGTFYVAVYGWCTPDESVVSWEYDGPCSYARNATFNITITLLPLPDNSCGAASRVYNELPDGTQSIEYNEFVEGSVNCNEYVYYRIEAPSPCQGLRIYVGNSTDPLTVPELSIGRWPNLHPTFDNLQWTSYNWGYQNLLIDIYDPNFDGGDSCGKFYNETCFYVIGVYGYCASGSGPVSYRLIATQASTTQNIFGDPKSRQQLGADGARRYRFCVGESQDVSAQFLRWDSACQCANKYVNYQMVISRTDENATIAELTWSIDAHEPLDAILLAANDSATRPGTYYLNVYGQCTDDAQCADACRCAPCSNMPRSKFAVFVSYDTHFNASESFDDYLGDCDGSNACDDADNVCANADAKTDGNGSDEDSLSDGEVAGIVIGIVLFVLLITLIALLACNLRKWSYTGLKQEKQELHNLSSHPAEAEDVVIGGMEETTL